MRAGVFEINGVQYEPKPGPVQGGRSYGRKFLLMAGLMGGFDRGIRQRERPAVDIIQEYGRIQRKESKLSRNDRDWVVSVFESNYQKVQP